MYKFIYINYLDKKRCLPLQWQCPGVCAVEQRIPLGSSTNTEPIIISITSSKMFHTSCQTNLRPIKVLRVVTQMILFTKSNHSLSIFSAKGKPGDPFCARQRPEASAPCLLLVHQLNRPSLIHILSVILYSLINTRYHNCKSQIYQSVALGLPHGLSANGGLSLLGLSFYVFALYDFTQSQNHSDHPYRDPITNSLHSSYTPIQKSSLLSKTTNYISAQAITFACWGCQN